MQRGTLYGGPFSKMQPTKEMRYWGHKYFNGLVGVMNMGCYFTWPILFYPTL